MNKNTISHYKFTLIELLVVIAIIAITTSSSIKVNLRNTTFLFTEYLLMLSLPVFMSFYSSLLI
ncbi:MAG: prepilin-type N-terminal cleavage/methylation domain-containing protein [Lentisphaerae bacterium]|nr:prepilin-type N-terminal cleavage/methylation domain-containing protein [Lentisphaerota bacterium]